MKILFDHPNPFLLAHGGFQTQIEQTKRALEELGLEVEWLRWWDATQTGDLIHYFGRLPVAYADFAHRKGMKVVMSELLTGLGSRPEGKRRLQKLFMQAARSLLPNEFTARLAWDAYRQADACIALTGWEGKLMEEFFGASAERVFVVPNGVEAEFLRAPAVERGKWLVCSATITPRKRVVELAEAALLGSIPLWVLGRPYAETDAYYQRFLGLQRRAPELIRFEGEVTDRSKLAAVYGQARGFVLLSEMESLSLSALEAATCGCPLLLSDLPWARSFFSNQASYCPLADTATTAKCLRSFYDISPQIQAPNPPASWQEVAVQLCEIYRKILSGRQAQG